MPTSSKPDGDNTPKTQGKSASEHNRQHPSRILEQGLFCDDSNPPYNTKISATAQNEHSSFATENKQQHSSRTSEQNPLSRRSLEVYLTFQYVNL
jgi:hypothetical protein